MERTWGRGRIEKQRGERARRCQKGHGEEFPWYSGHDGKTVEFKAGKS